MEASNRRRCRQQPIGARTPPHLLTMCAMGRGARRGRQRGSSRWSTGAAGAGEHTAVRPHFAERRVGAYAPALRRPLRAESTARPIAAACPGQGKGGEWEEEAERRIEQGQPARAVGRPRARSRDWPQGTEEKRVRRGTWALRVPPVPERRAHLRACTAGEASRFARLGAPHMRPPQRTNGLPALRTPSVPTFAEDDVDARAGAPMRAPWPIAARGAWQPMARRSGPPRTSSADPEPLATRSPRPSHWPVCPPSAAATSCPN